MSDIYSCDNCKHKDKMDGSCKDCIASYNTETNERGKPTHFEKKERPKICEILGVEVGEEFTFPYPNRTYDRVFIKENGQIWERVDRTGNTHRLGGAAVCWLINHADSIRKYPLLTEKESAICKAVGANWITKFDSFACLWKYKPTKSTIEAFCGTHKLGVMTGNLFPSVRNCDCIEVPYD